MKQGLDQDGNKTVYYFIAQNVATVLMIVGFLVFVLIWYLQNR